jgi:predicted permease
MILGCVGFFALGAAMPDRFPQKKDFAAAMPVIPLRFALPFLTLLVLRALGLAVPGGAWVVALAPNAFLAIAMARLYGYDRRSAAALPLLTVPIAAALIPLVAVLGGG